MSFLVILSTQWHDEEDIFEILEIGIESIFGYFFSETFVVIVDFIDAKFFASTRHKSLDEISYHIFVSESVSLHQITIEEDLKIVTKQEFFE